MGCFLTEQRHFETAVLFAANRSCIVRRGKERSEKLLLGFGGDMGDTHNAADASTSAFCL